MPKILVTVDFTPTSDKAIELAGNIAKATGDDLVLLHIFEAKHMGEKAAQAMKFSPIYKGLVNDLESLSESTRNTFGVHTSFLIKDGDIFEHISQTVKEMNCKMAVMGVHGLKGIQKITGSYAAQIISQCNHPFLTLQFGSKSALEGSMFVYAGEKIPDQSKQNWLIQFAKTFNMPVHLVVSKQVSSHVASVLNQNKDEFEKNVLQSEVPFIFSQADTAEEVLELAANGQAGLIAIIKNADSPEFSEDEIKLLYNQQQIPLLRL